MRMSPKARMNRLFTDGRCLDVAIDHGVCNEPSFMAGLEDIGGVVDQLIAAGPDAIQMNYGQADLLQSRPEKGKPALVMRIDMGNPYNDSRHRVLWAELQNRDEPIIGALEMDAPCASSAADLRSTPRRSSRPPPRTSTGTRAVSTTRWKSSASVVGSALMMSAPISAARRASVTILSASPSTW